MSNRTVATMRDDLAAPHYSPAMLIEYLVGTAEGPWMPEDLQMQVEEHLAECDRCAERAREQIERSQSIATTLDGWTAQAHGDAHRADARQRRSAVIAALRALWEDVSDPARRAQIARWIDDPEGATARVLLAATSAVSRIVSDELAARPPSVTRYLAAFAPPPPPSPAARAMPEPSLAWATALLDLGGPSVSVATLTVTRRRIAVELIGIREGQQTPLVLLVPEGRDRRPLLAQASRQRGMPHFVAEFRDLPAGEYLIAVEPPRGLR
jgi:hypothetical protein